MPYLLSLDRHAIQLYARPSKRDHTWMVCGYATDMPGEPETLHILAGYDCHQMQTIRSGQPLTFAAEPASSIGDIVTTQNFLGARQGTGLIVMQIVPRRVFGQPDLTMFAGTLQDPDGTLDPLWNKNEGVMLSGEVTEAGLSLHHAKDPARSTDMDLSWTPGHSLPQILTRPVWTLGADEPWAATWGLREDIVALAEEGRELRRGILTGDAGEEAQARLSEIYQLTQGAVGRVGKDPTFDRFEKGLLALGERDEGQYTGITTAAELERLESLADHAMKSAIEL